MHPKETPIRDVKIVLKAILLGFFLVLLHLIALYVVSDASGPKLFYQKLCTWDCTWYATIVERGYLPPPTGGVPDTAAFFPGLPILGRVVYLLSGLVPRNSVVVASHFATWALWSYLILLLQLLRAGKARIYLSIFALLAHPSSGFLLFGYSESLLLGAMAGMLYWMFKGKSSDWPKTAVHGFAMAGARLVGALVALTPVLSAILWKKRGKELQRAILASGVAILAPVLLFSYSTIFLGKWNAYEVAQRQYWGVTPDFTAIINPRYYTWHFGSDHLMVFAIILSLFGWMVLEIAGARSPRFQALYRYGWRTRLPLWGAAFGTYFLAFSAFAPKASVSMSRYSLPPLFLCLIGLNHWWSEFGTAIPRNVKRGFTLSACVILFFFLVRFSLFGASKQFLNGQWAG